MLENLDSIASKINSRFKRGYNASGSIKEIQSLPHPVLVDLNYTIAGNTFPFVAHPDAKEFLDRLATIGTPFIVTASSGWSDIESFLKDNRLWQKQMILMTAENYSFLTSDALDRNGYKLIEEFGNNILSLGISIDIDSFARAPGYKKIAFLFNKFPVPLIDDSIPATTNNPGILGITVQPWKPEGEGKFPLLILRENQPSLIH